MGIDKRIRYATDTLGLTLRQVADKCGISYSSLQNWAGGHREPRPEALITLGSQLGISIDWLLTGEGPMLRSGEQTHGVSDPSIGNEVEQAMLSIWRELDAQQQHDIQRVLEEKKRMNTLEKRLQELEAVVSTGKTLA